MFMMLPLTEQCDLALIYACLNQNLAVGQADGNDVDGDRLDRVTDRVTTLKVFYITRRLNSGHDKLTNANLHTNLRANQIGAGHFHGTHVIKPQQQLAWDPHATRTCIHIKHEAYTEDGLGEVYIKFKTPTSPTRNTNLHDAVFSPRPKEAWCWCPLIGSCAGWCW